MKQQRHDFVSVRLLKPKESESVYDKYADMLYRLALSNSASKEDAEDAVQDAFTAYFTSTPRFDSPEHEKAWFIRVTLNKCRDILRKNSVRAYTELSEVGDLPALEKEEDPAISALHRLHEKYRTVIALHYLEGYSLEETASILNLSLSAVKMRLSRGRIKLREILEKEEF